MSRRSGDATFLEWAVAGRPRPGEDVSGDVATVETIGARCVIAVIDGLGHGPEAAAAAELAVQAIETNRAEPLEALVLLTHEKLSTSRGAAATVAIIDGERGQMEWVGVGNVNGLLVRADDGARPHTHGVFLCRGVLGYKLPSLHISDPLTLEDGDTIVITTDGVRGDLTDLAALGAPVARAAGTMLTQCASDDDDALVFFGRYRSPTGSHRGGSAL